MTSIKLTKTDLIAFEKALIEAAQRQDEREVNVRNERRGYILFGMWQREDDRTPTDFASGQISLVLDGVAGIAIL
jgi:hypothetical protein